jgi:hypothetical protein
MTALEHRTLLAGAPLPIANTSSPGDVRPFGLATDFVIRTLP